MKLSIFFHFSIAFLWQSTLIGINMNVSEINQHIKECLTNVYKLDEQSAIIILKKFKPLIENIDHHSVLQQFITLSEIHVPSDATSISRQLPADDAVKAAPRYHEVLAETDRIRVLYGATNNGDQVPLHRHYWKSILINLEPSVFETEYADGSKEIEHDPIGVYALPPDLQAAMYKNLGNDNSFLKFEIKQEIGWCGLIQSTEHHTQPISVTIRFAVPEDIPACIELARHVSLTVYKPLVSVSDEQWEKILASFDTPSDPFYRHMSQLLVAETESNEIVGNIMIYPFSHPDVFATLQPRIDVDLEHIRQQLYDTAAYITRLHVNENYRNCGIGKKLLNAASMYFPAIKKFYLNTLTSNKNAIDFYEHLGFIREFIIFIDGKHENTVLSINTNQLK